MSKRDRWSMVLLAAVIILLPIAAALQYRWLGRVSEAEQERMRAVLRSAASQFGESFDREITRAYALFQHHGGTGLDGLAAAYAARLEEWQASAAHPEMLRDVYVVVTAADGAAQLLRCDKDARRFEPVDWPAELASFRDESALVSDYLREDVPALIIPAEREAGVLFTIVLLDRERISTAVIPALATRYFGDGAKDDLAYDVAVISRRDPPPVIFATAKDLASPGARADAAGTFCDVRLETLPIRAAEQRNLPPSTTSLRVIKRRVSTIETEESAGRWQLLVRHRTGSLEAAVAAVRRRNLGISSAVLLLLGASVAFLVIFSRRATRLAEDQLKFVAGVTHELRTPLAVICSAGENLADGLVAEPAKAREYGTVIRDEGRRLSRMVEQVLDYAGAQHGPAAYRFQPTDIAGVIEAAVKDCGAELQAGSVEIERKNESFLPPVRADAAALQRALRNLISNAVKYGDGRWVKISARDHREPPSREVRISVEDRGPGIAASDLPHIFDAFYRGADAVAAQVQGSGLGLSLVQRIAAAHGGRVTVESAVGRGSVFTIHLPLDAVA